MHAASGHSEAGTECGGQATHELARSVSARVCTGVVTSFPVRNGTRGTHASAPGDRDLAEAVGSVGVLELAICFCIGTIGWPMDLPMENQAIGRFFP